MPDAKLTSIDGAIAMFDIKELLDEILRNNNDLKIGVPELKGWFVNELETVYIDQITSKKDNNPQP